MGNSNSLLNDARADILTVIFLSFRVINTVSFPPHRYLVYHQLSPDFTPVFYSVFITNLFVIGLNGLALNEKKGHATLCARLEGSCIGGFFESSFLC